MQGEAVNEKTLVKTLDLPNGQPWAWYADANVVVLSPHLCPEGRVWALEEVSAHWRRSCLRIVPDEENFAGPPTEPFTLPRQSARLTMERQ